MTLGCYNLPLKRCHDFNEDIVLIGVAYDEGSRFRGASLAPSYLRNLSRKIFVGKDRFLMHGTNGGLDGFYNHTTNKRVLAKRAIADYGDIGLASLKETFRCRNDSCVPVVLGGDHTVTYRILENFHNRKPLSVFYLDAHEDVAERTTQCRNNNVVTWVRSLPKIREIYQVGLRGYSRIPASRDVFDSIYPAPALSWSPPAPKGRNDCYISIDLDVLDPYIFPCVSTPVVGGIEFRNLTRILNEIFKKYNVLGLDVVEYVPKKDRNGIAGLLVLDLILKIFEMIDAKHGGSGDLTP